MGHTQVQHGQQTVGSNRGAARSTRVRAFARPRSLFALALLLMLMIPSVALAATPHGDYAPALPTGSSKCAQCHRPHRAATTSGLLSIDATTGVLAQTALCFKCHGYAGPAKNAAASFEPALAGGHRVEDATGTVTADLTNQCSGCHEPHGVAKGLPRGEINGQDVSRTVDANSWCWACHDPALPRNWSGLTGAAYYDRLSQPSSMDASGYPTVGTLRGKAAYQAGAHASIAASTTAGRAEGDCLWCHASHRSPNARDGLLAGFGPTAPGDAEADLCFRCHDQAAGGYGMGHIIQSEDASLTAGSPLPCYECHNAHGSQNGNAVMISDALGSNLNPDSSSGSYTVETLSQFCYTCHTTSDGYWWDSVNGVMAPPEDIAQAPRQSVAGIDRLDGVLKLPAGPVQHTKDVLVGCSCHGASVHVPTNVPVSAGGQRCYACHSSYNSMEAGVTGNDTTYHHVMGTGTGDGDTAFAAGSYPTSASDLYCMSCHADHDQFNGAKAFNLRADLTSAATTASTDYLATGTYGVCVSCHSVSRSKDTTNQKSDGLADTDTPKIVGGTGAGGFGASAHNYGVGSTFDDATVFSANCAKCHNDEQPKGYQEGLVGRFGTHFSATRRLLTAFGAAQSDPLGEQHCYACHSRVADGYKSADGFDRYGQRLMIDVAGTESVYGQFQLAGSTHPVEATASGSVECESCHNAHVVQSTAGARVTDPTNTYNLAGYTTTTQRALFCLTCHDADGGPTRTVSDATYVPYDVRMTSPKMDKTLYGLGSHWVAGGSISAAETVACDTCHDSHGSDYTKLLGARDVATGSNRINGQAITGNDNSVCYACHTGASTSYPAFTREAVTGYAMNGTWPGRAVYTGATAIHATVGSNANGDCKTCHGVHGTANVYDELTAPFTNADFTLCFNCHDADGPATDNIKQWYPVSAGGTQGNTTDRAGHSGDRRVGGNVVPNPCYNCHNPHGSVSRGRNDALGNPTYPALLVVTQISSADPRVFGDAAGEYDLRTAQGVRDFCLSCHVVNSADNLGYSGTPGTSVAIQSTAAVDGYNRLTQLKITAGNAQRHTAYTGQSCLGGGCHPNAHLPQ